MIVKMWVHYYIQMHNMSSLVCWADKPENSNTFSTYYMLDNEHPWMFTYFHVFLRWCNIGHSGNYTLLAPNRMDWINRVALALSALFTQKQSIHLSHSAPQRWLPAMFNAKTFLAHMFYYFYLNIECRQMNSRRKNEDRKRIISLIWW